MMVVIPMVPPLFWHEINQFPFLILHISMVYMQKICYRNLIFHCYGIYVGLCVWVYGFACS